MIVLLQVVLRDVLVQMGVQPQKGRPYLQRGIGKKPEELQFGILFIRHEIQDGNLQLTDVLIMGTRIVHHKDVLMLQQFYGR